MVDLPAALPYAIALIFAAIVICMFIWGDPK